MTSQRARLILPATMAPLPGQVLRARIPRKRPNSAATGIDKTNMTGGFGQKQKVAAPKIPLKPAQASAFSPSDRSRVPSVKASRLFSRGGICEPSSGLFTAPHAQRTMKTSVINDKIIVEAKRIARFWLDRSGPP